MLNGFIVTNTYLHNVHVIKQEAHGPHRSPEKTVQIIKQI